MVRNTQKIMNREQWLNTMIDALRPQFKDNVLDLPERVRASCGWAPASASKIAGVKHPSNASGEKFIEIFISPKHDKSLDVLSILIHELCHAVHDGEDIEAHGKEWKATASTMGVQPSAKNDFSFTKEEIKIFCEELIAEHGEYPHSALTIQKKGAAKEHPLKKVWCPQCEYLCYITEKWIEALGFPTCPCGEAMELRPKE